MLQGIEALVPVLLQTRRETVVRALALASRTTRLPQPAPSLRPRAAGSLSQAFADGGDSGGTVCLEGLSSLEGAETALGLAPPPLHARCVLDVECQNQPVGKEGTLGCGEPHGFVFNRRGIHEGESGRMTKRVQAPYADVARQVPSVAATGGGRSPAVANEASSLIMRGITMTQWPQENSSQRKYRRLLERLPVMPRSPIFLVGVLFFGFAAILLLTRSSFETAIAEQVRQGDVTPEAAQRKRKERVWVIVSSFVVEAGFVARCFSA